MQQYLKWFCLNSQPLSPFLSEKKEKIQPVIEEEARNNNHYLLRLRHSEYLLTLWVNLFSYFKMFHYFRSRWTISILWALIKTVQQRRKEDLREQTSLIHIPLMIAGTPPAVALNVKLNFANVITCPPSNWVKFRFLEWCSRKTCVFAFSAAVIFLEAVKKSCWSETTKVQFVLVSVTAENSQASPLALTDDWFLSAAL